MSNLSIGFWRMAANHSRKYTYPEQLRSALSGIVGPEKIYKNIVRQEEKLGRKFTGEEAKRFVKGTYFDPPNEANFPFIWAHTCPGCGWVSKHIDRNSAEPNEHMCFDCDQNQDYPEREG
jgi:hypothetical protein